MHYTLGQAAKATGKSKPTIMRAIRDGKISCIEKTTDGYKIDPAELHRVFPPVKTDDVPEPITSYTDETGNLIRIKELEVKLEAALQRVTDKEQQITDLQQDRDHWRTHAERSTLMLEDLRKKEEKQREETALATAPKRRWWHLKG
jgi:hypothetical protein